MRGAFALVSIAASVGCGGQVKAGGDQGAMGGTTTTVETSTTGGTTTPVETTTTGGTGATGAAGSGATRVSTTGVGGSGGATQVAGAGGTAGGTSDQPPVGGNANLVCPTHAPLNNHSFATLEEKSQALVGRWTQCSKSGIGGEGSVGIEIAGDGRFTVLVRDASGVIVPGLGGLDQGHVEVTVNQVDFVADSTHQLAQMLFSDEVPYRMYAYNTDFIGYDYIR